jgi:hypothetical protein
MDKDSALPLLPQLETEPSDSSIYLSHGSIRMTLLEAELAKGKVIMELQKKPIA